jgi:hypothetical protein
VALVVADMVLVVLAVCFKELEYHLRIRQHILLP